MALVRAFLVFGVVWLLIGAGLLYTTRLNRAKQAAMLRKLGFAMATAVVAFLTLLGITYLF